MKKEKHSLMQVNQISETLFNNKYLCRKKITANKGPH